VRQAAARWSAGRTRLHADDPASTRSQGRALSSRRALSRGGVATTRSRPRRDRRRSTRSASRTSRPPTQAASPAVVAVASRARAARKGSTRSAFGRWAEGGPCEREAPRRASTSFGRRLSAGANEASQTGRPTHRMRQPRRSVPKSSRPPRAPCASGRDQRDAQPVRGAAGAVRDERRATGGCRHAPSRRSPANRAACATPSAIADPGERKRRYFREAAERECWPLSGGGSGSPSRAGERWNGAPSVAALGPKRESTPGVARSSAISGRGRLRTTETFT